MNSTDIPLVCGELRRDKNHQPMRKLWMISKTYLVKIKVKVRTRKQIAVNLLLGRSLKGLVSKSRICKLTMIASHARLISIVQ